MKVKELVEQLTNCNQEADVIVYSSDTEDASRAYKVYDKEAGSQLYCKADPIEDLAHGRDFVVIG